MLTRALILLAAAAVLLAGEGLPTPDEVKARALGNGALKTSSGEQFTWHAAFRSHDFIEGFEVTGDAAWLQAAQEFYDWCLAEGVSDDPDGFPGTIGADIGTRIDNVEVVADTVVGDANIAWPLVQFARLVQAHPELKARFGAKADAYTALAVRMCWDKWDKRGCYVQDTLGYGSYRTHTHAIAKADRKRWVARLDDPISDNLNKHYKIGMVFLNLWRLTGDAKYRDRVIAIFSRAKAMFRLFPDEDRLVWNFWMPHGAYDIAGTSPRSWVAVHPERPAYQAFECGAFLAVYDHGLVFDQQDIERIVRTNQWMIANGLQNADGTAKAGCVWGALAGLDETIRNAAMPKGGKDPLGAAHLAQMASSRKGYARTDAPDAKQILVSAVPVQPGRRLGAALAIPEVIELADNGRSRLLSRSMEAGMVVVELLSADGAQVLGELARQEVNPKQGAYACPRWDGTNPKTKTKDLGTYLVRWTLNGESRTWPISVIQGTAKPKPAGLAPLAAGGELRYDFEQALDARWRLENGAALAGEEKVQGAQALKIAHKQSARLRFGDEDDLPVRITFAAFDGGAKHGKKNQNGAALCLQTADGNLFAIRQTWRGYLNGDADWAWFNNGENQWFSPHPAGLARQSGWNRWLIDCSDPAAIVVERDGKRIDAGRLQPTRFVPLRGGVALEFTGPAEAGDPPLHVDDLTVTFPKKP